MKKKTAARSPSPASSAASSTASSVSSSSSVSAAGSPASEAGAVSDDEGEQEEPVTETKFLGPFYFNADTEEFVVPCPHCGEPHD